MSSPPSTTNGRMLRVDLAERVGERREEQDDERRTADGADEPADLREGARAEAEAGPDHDEGDRREIDGFTPRWSHRSPRDGGDDVGGAVGLRRSG